MDMQGCINAKLVENRHDKGKHDMMCKQTKQYNINNILPTETQPNNPYIVYRQTLLTIINCNFAALIDFDIIG
jgi:hypothetical protein